MRRLSFLLAAGAVACGSGDDTPGPPTHIEIVTGNGQSAPVGTALALSPSFRVKDDKGHVLPAINVSFTVQGGGGSISDTSEPTDSNGIATLPRWTLGTTAGTNTLRASPTGVAASVALTATALPGPPSAIVAIGPQIYASLVNQAVAPAPTLQVVDQYQNPVSGVVVTFSVTQGGGQVTGAAVSTDANGQAKVGSWILGPGAGLNRIAARTANGIQANFDATAVTGTPILTAVSVTSQTGFRSFQVPLIPRVLVKDPSGAVLSNFPVTFTLAGADNGLLSGGSTFTRSNGVASPNDWKLGNSGQIGTVIASLPGFPGPSVSYSATGAATPAFVIDVRFLSTMAPGQRDAFVLAAQRWMQVIIADIPDVALTNIPAGACANGTSPALDESADDVIIFASVVPIDGVGGVLGSAGPCINRINSFTAVGSMRFDSADLVGLETDGRLQAVITHEMGHVLGFGTNWSALVTGLGSSDPTYHGAAGLALWPSLTLGYPGTPVPVEGTPAPLGTRDSHWRESVFHAELMTGYIEAIGVPMPLSKMTIAVLADLGYTVDYSVADPFFGLLMAPGGGAVPTGTPINDQPEMARYEVTPTGRLILKLP